MRVCVYLLELGPLILENINCEIPSLISNCNNYMIISFIYSTSMKEILILIEKCKE